MVRGIPLGKLQIIWAVIWGHAFFLLFEFSLADVDIFYSDSLSRNLAFHCFMFMPEMSNRMVFVNGKHPWFFFSGFFFPIAKLENLLRWSHCLHFHLLPHYKYELWIYISHNLICYCTRLWSTVVIEDKLKSFKAFFEGSTIWYNRELFRNRKRLLGLAMTCFWQLYLYFLLTFSTNCNWKTKIRNWEVFLAELWVSCSTRRNKWQIVL